ncbi:hypothetical protein TNCT_200491 [Trichonephila clavata]|uniref:Uncharacterized protein n=1 Tax=Trichonephila clavata TaxID=2740835 RepID=A0A8X6HL33_TRICU|nr:hypothetical protein TNCT_200491 [Trichonephila clavata]
MVQCGLHRQFDEALLTGNLQEKMSTVFNNLHQKNVSDGPEHQPAAHRLKEGVYADERFLFKGFRPNLSGVVVKYSNS